MFENIQFFGGVMTRLFPNFLGAEFAFTASDPDTGQQVDGSAVGVPLVVNAAACENPELLFKISNQAANGEYANAYVQGEIVTAMSPQVRAVQFYLIGEDEE